MTSLSTKTGLSVVLTQQMRTQMARTLATALEENGITIKHTLANRIVARMFGFNEHSIAQAVREGSVSIEYPEEK